MDKLRAYFALAQARMRKEAVRAELVDLQNLHLAIGAALDKKGSAAYLEYEKALIAELSGTNQNDPQANISAAAQKLLQMGAARATGRTRS